MNVPRGNRGYSLVELMVVAVLGLVILTSIYQVLLVNQRTFTVNAAKVESQQAVRAGAEILFGELRELSAQGGDILGFGDDTLKVRVARQFGLVCARNYAANQLRLRRAGDWFEVGDSVVVFADTDTTTAADDSWLIARISSRDTTQSCAGSAAQTVTLPILTTAAGTPTFDTVQVGAPMRTFVHYTYGLFTVDGEPYLARRDAAGTVVPLAGPLQAANGVRFTYYDRLGGPPASAADIAQIEVTLRTLSAARGMGNSGQIGDSITTKIFTRN